MSFAIVLREGTRVRKCKLCANLGMNFICVIREGMNKRIKGLRGVLLCETMCSLFEKEEVMTVLRTYDVEMSRGTMLLVLKALKTVKVRDERFTWEEKMHLKEVIGVFGEVVEESGNE